MIQRSRKPIRSGLQPQEPELHVLRSDLQPLLRYADPAPVEAWTAWSDCGDGRQLHVVIDRQARQVWLLSAEEDPIPSRSTL